MGVGGPEQGCPGRSIMRVEMSQEQLKVAMEEIYQAAIAAVDPRRAVLDSLVLDGDRLHIGSRTYNLNDFRRVYLIGVGKAGEPMAKAVEEIFGDRLEKGVVVVKNRGSEELRKTVVLEAGHPEPDERGLEAARQCLEFADSNLTHEDLLLMVISGGGSALWPAPVEGITLADKTEATRVLLRSGATIQEMNAIRKHLSRIKGGRLLEHTSGCDVISLMLSDVVGDDMASIASGPTSPDPTTFQDCLDIIKRLGIEERLPEAVVRHLRKKAEESLIPGSWCETPKPGQGRFYRVQNEIVAGNFKALQAAAAKSSELGFTPLILSSSVYGNVSDIARFNVAVAREILSSGNPLKPPCCVISGGETTVRVHGDGKGGRNQEFALWCALETADWGRKGFLFASVGSDGCDGPTDAAGAYVTPETLAKARDAQLSIRDYLTRNDSYHFFKELGDLIVTGDTHTNVMDLQLILVEAPSN